MNGARGTGVMLAVAFIVGALAGAALDRVYVARQAGAGEHGGELKLTPAQLELRARAEREGIPWAVADLDLTDAQKVKIRALAGQRRPQADSLMAQVLPRVRMLETEMFQDILCLLNDDQRARWERRMHEGQFPDSIVQLRLARVRNHTCQAEAATPR